MSDVHQSTLEALIALVGLLVTLVRLLGPLADKYAETWANKQWVKLNAKLPDNVRVLIREAAIFGAQAAEKMDVSQIAQAATEAKKRYAVQAAERWLKALGYSVDLTTLGDAVEAVILQGLHLPVPIPAPLPAPTTPAVPTMPTVASAPPTASAPIMPIVSAPHSADPTHVTASAAMANGK